MCFFFQCISTGWIDAETAEMMAIPRCQVPDIRSEGLQVGNFAFSGNAHSYMVHAFSICTKHTKKSPYICLIFLMFI